VNRRPLSITVIGWVYIAMGAVGFIYHFPELRTGGWEAGWVELVRLFAVACGVFLLRGHNWARWGALAWIAFHVVVGALHGPGQFAMHAVFCSVIGWVLFRREARRYFGAG
jgi:hypothetical protein